jgi:hypothetical protein
MRRMILHLFVTIVPVIVLYGYPAFFFGPAKKSLQSMLAEGNCFFKGFFMPIRVIKRNTSLIGVMNLQRFNKT